MNICLNLSRINISKSILTLIKNSPCEYPVNLRTYQTYILLQ